MGEGTAHRAPQAWTCSRTQPCLRYSTPPLACTPADPPACRCLNPPDALHLYAFASGAASAGPVHASRPCLPAPTPHHVQTYPSFKTQLEGASALPGSLSQSSTPPAQVAWTPALSACASNLKPRNTLGPHLSVSLSGLDSQLPSSCLAPMGSQRVC